MLKFRSLYQKTFIFNKPVFKNINTTNFLPKVSFHEATSKIKSTTLLYFTDKDNIRDFDHYNSLNPLQINDLEKNGICVSYLHHNAQSQDSFNRVAIVNIPDKFKFINLNDREHTNSKIVENVSKAIRNFSLEKEFSIMFDRNLDIESRKAIINNLILSTYKFSRQNQLNAPDPKEEISENIAKKKSSSNSKTTSIKKKKTDAASLSPQYHLKFMIESLNKNTIDDYNRRVIQSFATLITRELANTRGNEGTTDFMLKFAKSILNTKNSNITVISGQDLKKKGYKLIHAVGNASEQKPMIVALEYYGLSKSKPISHAIVGKGITFDTGGLNLKPTGSMESMYKDKHGACNAIAIFDAVTKLKLPINLVCVLGLAENSVDSKSYRPSDIITSKKGLTVEIGNTDAEGRLVLADCLTFVQENYNPQKIIDVATLTGAVGIALGTQTAGLFTNCDQMANQFSEISE